MNKNQTIAAAAVTLVIAGSSLYNKISRNVTIDHLIARFPELNLDRKLANRIHGEMMRESFMQKYANLEMNEETYNTIFLSKYKARTSK